MRPLLLMLLTLGSLSAAWKAGMAKVDITPAGPIWMAGYAARTKPSEGVLTPLYAKALALEDEGKHHFVIVSTDIIGYPRTVADEIAIGCLKRFGLQRSELVLNASHTHSGPVVWPNLASMYFFDDQEKAKVEAFTRILVKQVIEVVGEALGKVQEARVEYGAGVASFAMHRRLKVDGQFRNAPNPSGPTDHRVPVLKVTAKDGVRLGVLFAYSCHNTTMTGEFYQLNGDYAGFAQAGIEAKIPGAVAMYVAACGGDQNPYPRSTLEAAQAHGRELAEAVIKVLDGPGELLRGRIRSAFQSIDLPYQPFGRNDFEAALQSSNRYEVSRAKLILKAMDERREPRRMSYPIQAVKLGQLQMVTLGGEVVVDYCLRLRRETANDRLVVLGYSNDVMSYIPTKQQLAEGGYEGKDSFLYYGQPAPLRGDSEDLIVESAKALLKKVK